MKAINKQSIESFACEVMKLLIVLVTIGFIAVLVYAAHYGITHPVSEDRKWEYPHGLVVIDSCEYLATQVNGAIVLTHKGNCRFCWERNKK